MTPFGVLTPFVVSCEKTLMASVSKRRTFQPGLTPDEGTEQRQPEVIHQCT